jgi:hypothetical protein
LLLPFVHQVELVLALGSVRPTDLNVKYLCLVMLVVVPQVVLVDQLIQIEKLLNLVLLVLTLLSVQQVLPVLDLYQIY